MDPDDRRTLIRNDHRDIVVTRRTNTRHANMYDRVIEQENYESVHKNDTNVRVCFSSFSACEANYVLYIRNVIGCETTLQILRE